MNRRKITSLIAIVLLSAIVFFGTSCCRCTGVDFYETQWQTRQFQIASTDWRLSEKCETFWYARRQFPQLTRFVFDEGAVLGYLIVGNSRVPLPDTWVQVILLDNGEEYVFSETYSFEIEPGWITFTHQTSDAFMERPPTQNFHVVLIW